MVTPPGEATGQEPLVSVVMPCLNEAETLAACIDEALGALGEAGLAGEVVVADNGSTDGSPEIARARGARVIHVAVRGYGSALRAGIMAARGRYVVMGDADASYDFRSIPAFVDKLREGHDLVVGNRFRGGIEPGAMPPLHRWLGNPVLSFLGRLFFRSRIGDFHCGMRAFTRDAFERMHLQTSGMEFASEMIIASTLLGQRIAEVPTVLRPDGRSRRPHLRTWRDGWRHLRFMLLYSPRWLFLVPGSAMLLVGLLGLLWLVPSSRTVGSVTFDIHTLLMAAMLAIVGYQVVVFAVFTRTFATCEGLYPEHDWLRRLQRYVTLEVGLSVGALMVVAGMAAVVMAFQSWQQVHFEQLDPRMTMRQLIPACVLLVIGTQTIFSSFFLSILGLRRVSNADLSAAAEGSSQVAVDRT
ncbi:MAG TPA: glycosyltransferase family 2 protein [Candidatus Dormibacteraeota bacterium]